MRNWKGDVTSVLGYWDLRLAWVATLLEAERHAGWTRKFNFQWDNKSQSPTQTQLTCQGFGTNWDFTRFPAPLEEEESWIPIPSMPLRFLRTLHSFNKWNLVRQSWFGYWPYMPVFACLTFPHLMLWHWRMLPEFKTNLFWGSLQRDALVLETSGAT